jgi:predicted nucleic acid-binding protein
MQEKVYVDTSALIILNKIDALGLLNKIYGNVFITNFINAELSEILPSWIIIEPAHNFEQSFLKNFNLGPGESSIIMNALEYNLELVML